MCEYKFSDGQACTRGKYGIERFCVLHTIPDGLRVDIDQHREDFEAKFKEESEQETGDWRGVIFPSNIDLPSTINYPIDASGAIFGNQIFKNVKFEADCKFLESQFKGHTQFNNCNFNGNVSFDYCNFNEKTEFLNVFFRKTSSFFRAIFSEKAYIRANFCGSTNFNSATFKDAVTFSGWRTTSGDFIAPIEISVVGSTPEALVSHSSNLTLRLRFERGVRNTFAVLTSYARHKKNAIRRIVKRSLGLIAEKFGRFKRKNFVTKEGITDYSVFEKEVHLENVTFYKPDQVVFNNVDMSWAYLLGTNFRGVRFLGVTWFQKKLSRNGIYNEIFLRESGDASVINKNSPLLEESYRNIRVALESNLNFSAASDFYIGEMEAYRSQLNFFQRHFFSVVAWYKAVSFYGTNVFVAFRFFIWILLLHWVMTIYLNFKVDEEHISNTLYLLQRSLSLVAFQSQPDIDILIPNVFAQKWADIGLKLFGLSQLAMLIFAFRARIKRH
jgi:uncharacterized protein YjbI with pentapeptide repeats